MKGLKILFVLFCCLSINPLLGKEIDTLSIYSESMQKNIKNIVILPSKYYSQPNKKFPVVYLLHGYDANYKTWLAIKKKLPELATQHNYIIVCPDGSNSWYWDSPIKAVSRYESYISQELIQYIDSHYRTFPSPNARAISGFSMGGQGALWLTIQHPDVFGACGSTSGVLDIRLFPRNWNLATLLGTYNKHKSRWNDFSVLKQIHKLKNTSTFIYFDCGTDDVLIHVNNKLHEKMKSLNMDHIYKTTKGAHNVSYWRQSINNHLLYFECFFKKQKLFEL